MRALALVLQMIIRVLFVVNLVLGILFITGHLLGLVMLHETFGIVIAICLVVLAVLAMRSAGAIALGLLGIVVAILLPVVGLGQVDVLVGSGHGLVELIHVLVGVAAIALAEVLGARYRRATRVGRA